MRWPIYYNSDIKCHYELIDYITEKKMHPQLEESPVVEGQRTGGTSQRIHVDS